MKSINRSVINWYELELDKEAGVAYLRRYNRPATSTDHGELFIQKLSVERFYKLAYEFACFGFYHENEVAIWYNVGVRWTGECYRTGSLFRM